MGNVIFGISFFSFNCCGDFIDGLFDEAFVCSIRDKFTISRGKLVTITCVLGFLGSTIFCTRAGLAVLDLCDHFVNNYAIVLSGLVECLLVGWFIKSRVLRKHVNDLGERKLWAIWEPLVCYVVPVVLLLVLGSAFYADLRSSYGGYSALAIFVYGVGF